MGGAKDPAQFSGDRGDRNGNAPLHKAASNSPVSCGLFGFSFLLTLFRSIIGWFTVRFG
jgi:hypothetical protein